MISERQIVAAGELHDRLKGWKDADLALSRLSAAFRDNADRQSVLVKASALNGLYATSVKRIYQASDHIVAKMLEIKNREWSPADRVETVHELARVPKATCRNGYELLTSFASKYAYFFINPMDVGIQAEFPIYDSYAANALLHLTGRRGDLGQHSHPYADFCGMIDEVAPIEFSSRQIDRYLWLKGQHLAFRNGRGDRLSPDVRGLFQSEDSSAVRLVRELASE